MYGLAVVVVLCGVVLVEQGGRPVFRLPILVLAYSFFIYSLVYGNSLTVSKDYKDFRYQLVYEDLIHLPQFKNRESVEVYFPEKTPPLPALRKQFLAYPMLEISYKEYWERGKLNDFIIEEIIGGIPDIQLPMLVDTYYHTIYGDDKMIIIKWKEDGKLVE